MLQGALSHNDIINNFHVVNQATYSNGRWQLYEDNEQGEDVQMIAYNITFGYYVYTWETLGYTVRNLDEYNIRSINDID